jgi:hypothetical protein
MQTYRTSTDRRKSQTPYQARGDEDGMAKFRQDFGRLASLVTGPKLAVRLLGGTNRNGRPFSLKN